jgi:primosomal protein N' (replication factor Y)
MTSAASPGAEAPATAEVAVTVPLRQTFHYRVPAALEARVQPGARVLVPFGPRRLVGYVVARDTPPPPGVKLVPIAAALDDERPTFGPALLGLLRWMADYYHAPPGDVFRAAHPAGTNARPVPALRPGPTAADGPLEEEARALLARLAAAEGPVPVGDLGADAALVRRLLKAGLVEKASAVEAPRVEVRTERGVVAVAPAPVHLGTGAGGRRVKRDDIHAWLVGRGVVPVREVRDAFPGAAEPIRRLVAEGRIAEVPIEVVRDPFFGEAVSPEPAPELTAAQRRAVEAIGVARGYAGFLLHGVTGSGKTEVYLRAIQQKVAEGRGALVLVPEIALTPQLVRRFRARLGDGLAVLHSGLSDGARFDQWRRLRRGEVRVAIGARSAVFAPVPDLGLIVVDEEHDPSFKQEEGVRYHARDMALLRGSREGAAVVLGSATPSMETVHNVAQGKLQRLVLAERPAGGKLPAVELIDLARHPAPRDVAPFLTVPLRNALAEALGRGEQSILFLNRRGFGNFVICRSCREVLQCDQCAISMTWHRRPHMLRCHYCDAARPLPRECPACRRPELEPVGQGTERVEDALATLFPQARVARLDRDTAAGRGLTDILDAMRAGAIDILVGTQMVTKGHDFPNVTLVGVLAADAGLSFPDFRAYERTFQLLSQVAGRAGRGRRPGRVLVQTRDPENRCLVTARRHDHAAFATEELKYRQEMGYPPFTFAAAVRVDGREPAAVEEAARRAAAVLTSEPVEGVRLRGPAPAPIERIRGRTRWAMLLTATRRADRTRLLAALESADLSLPRDVRLALDVDPQDFL